MDENDENDKASIMMEEKIDISLIIVENQSSTSIGLFSLSLITFNEESQEETEETQEEADESEADIEECKEDAKDEPNLVPTWNNNKKKRSLVMTGPSKLSKRICF